MAKELGYIRFKNEIDLLLFMAAIALEELSFEDLREEFRVSPNDVFEQWDPSRKKMTLMSFKDAEAAGYRVLAFREEATEEEKRGAKSAVTTIFFSDLVEKGRMLNGWKNDSGTTFYFIPPGEYNNYFMDCINYEFDKAIMNISKAFTVKESGRLMYLHRKPWVALYSQKWLRAWGGLKVVGFDFDKSFGLMPGGDLVPMNDYEEDVVKLVKDFGNRPSLLQRLMVRATGERTR